MTLKLCVQPSKVVSFILAALATGLLLLLCEVFILMFEISTLKSDVTLLKELICDCVDVPEGEEAPKVIIEINDRVRKEEAKLSKQYLGKIIFSDLGKTQEFHNDRLSYLQSMVDVCVKDSDRLFSEGGKPAAHDNKAFKTLLLRYPVFASWFGNALTEAFAEVSKFKTAEASEQEKN